MKKGPPIVLSVSLALVASLVLAPTAALAERFHGGPVAGGRVGGGPVLAHPFAPHHRFVPHRFFPRPFLRHRPFISFGAILSPVVVYAPPPVFSGPPAYYDSPASYDPPAVYSRAAVYGPPVGGTVSVAPAPPSMPSVIEYPTGRYELRGDGVTTPYMWVWIPNPPPPPPPGPPSDAAAPPAPSASGDQSPARYSQLYRWTDGQGVGHWTNRWDAVPEEYRAQAKRPQPS